MSDADLPEADRIEGAPHPRETLRLFGQEAAEATFLQAHSTQRLHHAWLLTGPRGIGKASFAWRAARFLLASPPVGDDGLFGAEPEPAPETLDIPADHPVARRMPALSEPRFKLLRRAWDDEKKRLETVISVKEVRKLKDFFHLSAADGGHRAAIVDSADELNPNAANALLKVLEEPPAAVTFFLICHQPAGLLPTIRSRCRELRLAPLSPENMAAALHAAGSEAEDPTALSALSEGSVGAAIRLLNLDGMVLYAGLVSLFSTLPRLDRQKMLALADLAAARGAGERFDLLLGLFDLFLSRLARAGVLGSPVPEAAKGEAQLMARLSPDANAARLWAETQQFLGARARHGRAVNLDPAALVTDMVLKIDETAAQIFARP